MDIHQSIQSLDRVSTPAHWLRAGVKFFLIAALFTPSLCSPAAITIVEMQALSFPTQIQGLATTATVLPTEPTAAIFQLTGDPNVAITASVVEASIQLTLNGSGSNNATMRLTVDGWSFGGQLAANGTAFISATGTLTNLRVGATATIAANDKAGSYSGTATLRIVYS